MFKSKQKKILSWVIILALLISNLVGFSGSQVVKAAAIIKHVVISQIYGGGGNSGATYANDFVELYNPTDSDVDLTGWSVQYQSAAATTAFAIEGNLSGKIKSHGYYLFAGATGGAVGAAIPTADAASTTVNLSGTTGKVALANTTTFISGKTDAAVIDFVGYGTAVAYEGTGAAPAPSNVISIQRKNNNGTDPSSLGDGNGNGWDTDNNSTDFIISSPIRLPKNTSSLAEGGTVTPPANIAVTGVSLDPSTLTLGVGQTTTPSAITTTISPSTATNKTVTWSSGNPSVATITTSGAITAVTTGTAIMTVTTVDGAFKSLCTVTVTANAPPTNKTFDIVEITDFHGQLLDSTNTKPVGAALAKVVKDVKATNPDRTLIIGGGDLYQGTPVSNVLRGLPVQQVMSNIGMEVTALGNHEFDWGLDAVNKTMLGANYSIVCANMYNKGTNDRPYAPYKIITKDGVKIAVIGAILKDAPTIIMPALVAPFDFRDPATEINAVAAELRAKTGADKIDIILADVHDGGSSLNAIVSNLKGVDAVFGGHDHTVADTVNVDANGNSVPTLDAASTGKGFIDLKITVDPTKKIIGFSAKGTNWNALTTTVTSPTDPDCKKIVDDASAALLPIFNEVIGKDTVEYTSGQADSPYGESQLGNWMSDVVKNYAPSPADVGMVNNGGIRLSPIPAGDITVGTIFNIMPFDNTICTTNMTGAQLRYIFEQAVQTNGKGIQISGVKFTYDSTKPSFKPAVVATDGTITTAEVPGQRVLSIIREKDGTTVKDTDILKVNAPDFVATGGDTFTGFLVPSIVSSLVDSHYTVRDALNDDVRANKKITVVMNNRVDNQMVVQSPVAMSIAAARTTDKIGVILTGTVTSVAGKNVWMQDNGVNPTAGICVYNSAGFTAQKGDKITVTGNLSVYNGLLEVTPTKVSDVVTISSNNVVTPKEVKVYEISDALQGELIKIKNVAFTSIDNTSASMAKDSTGSVNIYAMPVVTGLSVGDTADVTAAVTRYTTTLELSVASASDVVKTGTQAPTAATISIIGTSDVHGAIFPLDYNTGLAANVGLAKVSTYVKSVKGANPNTMLIDNGDTIQGTPLSYYYDMIDTKSEYPMMKVMGAMGYDTWTLGNHEFNYGLTTLNRIMGDAKKENISVLSANTYNTDNTNFVKPYIIKSFNINGKTIKVAILGLTTKCIPSWEDPSHYAGLHFNDLVDEAKKWVPIARATQADGTAGADVVIVSAHTGTSTPSDTIPENQADAIAKQVSGIDAILCGHAHTGKTYSFTNPDGKVIPVVEPKNGDGIFSQIDLNIDGTGKVEGVTAFDLTLPATTAADPAILTIAKPYQDATLAYTNTVIGKSTDVFEGAKQLTEPSTIMELVNKVQANGAGTTLSIAAPLSLTAKVPQGDVKRQDIMGVYVYENFLYGLKMTGSQLKNWLEWSVRYYKQTTSSTDPIVKDPTLNIADYNLDQLYGATYDIDLSQTACTTDSNGKVITGNRIKNLKINGVLVADTDILKIAVNNYRYNGGGGFMAAAGFVPGSQATIDATFYDSAKALGDDGQVRNMMFKYVQDNGTISPTNSNNWKISAIPVMQQVVPTDSSTTVVVPVVTNIDSNSNIVATIDASNIDINKANVITVNQDNLPKPESQIQVKIPAGSVGTGTGSFEINTKAVSLSIPTSIIDPSLLSSGGTLRVSENLMPATDATPLLANVPTGAKINGKVFTLVMATYDSNNNLVSIIHNFGSGKSIGVTMNLSADDIKGMDTSKISAFYFDTVTKNWIEMPGAIFDLVKMTVTFNTTHFTDFTIMQKSAMAVAQPSHSGSGAYVAGATPSGEVKPVVPSGDVTPVVTPAASTVNRLSGPNRIETSIAIAKEQYTDTKPDAVVLATADGFADALAGSGLAYKNNAPLLLVNKTVSDSQAVLDYITTNLSKDKTIYILGETGVISKEISDYLTTQGYKIVRLGGKDRYETNQKIVDNLNVAKGISLVITTGDEFADALSISSIADIKGFPVLLNGKDNLSASVSNDITNLQPTTVYVVGGAGVLSSNIETQIKNLNGAINIVRLGGKDRYETSMMIVDYFNLLTTTMAVATGLDFPDALSGSVLAARKNASVLLVDNKDITKQKELLSKEKITSIILFGGEGVISNDIAASLMQK